MIRGSLLTFIQSFVNYFLFPRFIFVNCKKLVNEYFFFMFNTAPMYLNTYQIIIYSRLNEQNGKIEIKNFIKKNIDNLEIFYFIIRNISYFYV